ncbi:MAG: UbiA family prenyltransferase [Candidatus Kapabacteria bacterium]|nr:UbiA family prenyltransferase [Candidatus Kapabacteria bacterium]
MSTPAERQRRILYVDLDNTLLATDVLWESIVLLAKQQPLAFLLLPFWMLKGKVFFKQQIANRVQPDMTTLPVNQPVLDFIHEEKKAGRRVILATASMQTLATKAAAHFDVFDGVIATTDGENMGGRAKLAAMKRMSGEQPFDYIGDRSVDIPIWKECAETLAVNPTASLRKKAGGFTKEFHGEKRSPKVILKALRVYQWVKNLLLFIPMILAHKVGDTEAQIHCVLAFFVFSLSASSVYVLNDVLDVESDRAHPRKSKRPFASGALPLQYAVYLIPLLLLVAFSVSTTLLPPKFTLALVLYLAMTTAYSVYLKQLPIVDVLMLAGLYSFRILAGAQAAEVPVSAWMLAFSLFIFLSLAFIKRYTELLVMRERNQISAKGRGYVVSDIDIIRTLGPISGYMAVLVLALYINSTDVAALYSHPFRLWFVVPLMLYWITRVWFVAHRGEMHDDPIVFALKDKISYILCAIAAVIVYVATN